MLFSAIRYVIWVSILLLVLSVLSFVILMRDPLNADLITNNIYSAYYHYLTSLLQGDLGIDKPTLEILCNARAQGR